MTYCFISIIQGKMSVEIIMYHYVRDISNSSFPGIKGLEYRDFAKQLNFLKQEYSFVSMTDIIQSFRNGKRLPERSVLLTFDDGYLDHYKNVFPILCDEGIPAVFSVPGKVLRERKVLDVNKIQFVLASGRNNEIHRMLCERLDYYRGEEFPIADNETLYKEYAKPRNYDSAEVMFLKRLLQYVLPEYLRNTITDELFRKYVTSDEEMFADELYMNIDQAIEMKQAGMEFAIHGYEHYHFDNLCKEDYASDLKKALTVLEGIVDQHSWVFCYPYGDLNDELVSYCKGEGCVAGLTCEPRTVDFNVDDIYRLPRYDTNDYPPKKKCPTSWGG